MNSIIKELTIKKGKYIPASYHDIEEGNKWMMKYLKDRYKEAGIREGIEQTAINLLNLNVDIEIISKATEMSINELKKLEERW